MTVAVLFARQDSSYKSLAGCDVYDIDRDARTWPGGTPAVAHPPCRAWGRLRQFSKPRVDEKALAVFAVECVRRFGGVVEHPERSALWDHLELPRPGAPKDAFGGWSMCVDQVAFGHRARKRTWLYVVGVEPRDIPAFPLFLGSASHCIRPTKSYPRLPSVTKDEREHTPPAFGLWLVAIAAQARVGFAGVTQ